MPLFHRCWVASLLDTVADDADAGKLTENLFNFSPDEALQICMHMLLDGQAQRGCCV
jgi:hypothetical protein